MKYIPAPDHYSQETAKLLYLALAHLVAVLRTPDDPVASGALESADIVLTRAALDGDKP